MTVRADHSIGTSRTNGSAVAGLRIPPRALVPVMSPRDDVLILSVRLISPFDVRLYVPPPLPTSDGRTSAKRQIPTPMRISPDAAFAPSMPAAICFVFSTIAVCCRSLLVVIWVQGSTERPEALPSSSNAL
ncbi:MAG: hypothetical protein VR65_25070 [Desulfobulbaceae bacterium BRH_c16a]|nr:MAG: hypothetical protein VR65_25070 [Desulfobulbaceae bacterium BRH_c16a]